MSLLSRNNMASNILIELDAAKNKLIEEGKNIINLSIGTPDLPPDIHVMEAYKNAVMEPQNYKYAMNDKDELVEAVCSWYNRRYHVILNKNQITSVSGSQEGIAHIAFVLCEHGDTVLVPDPGYPIFSFGPFIAGANLVSVPLVKENDFLMDFEKIPGSVAHAAKMILVSYPGNPITATAAPDFYERLVYFAKKYEIAVVHDNAYSEMIYEGDPGISFLSIKGAADVGIEFNSLSKTYNLTGIRVSFAVGNEEIIKKFKAFRSQIDYGLSLPIQIAAAAALNGPQDIVKRNLEEYKRRRDTLCGGLNRMGWKVPYPKGTMFTWFPLPRGYDDSTKFTFDLLNKAGVLCVPGVSFGALGEGYVRMALVQDIDTLQLAVKQIHESGILAV